MSNPSNVGLILAEHSLMRSRIRRQERWCLRVRERRHVRVERSTTSASIGTRSMARLMVKISLRSRSCTSFGTLLVPWQTRLEASPTAIPSKLLFLENFLAHPARFERATSAFGGQRSIQLSYGCVPELGSLHQNGSMGQSRWWPNRPHRTRIALSLQTFRHK